MPAWLPWLGLGVLAAAGLALTLWALLADRARHRRCLGCRYDMTGVPGRRCPECGREHREGDLFRTRRRWRSAGVGAGVVVVAVGGTWALNAHGKPGGLWNLAPTFVLLRHLDGPGAEPREAFERRLGVPSGEPGVASPRKLSRKNWERLAMICRDIAVDPATTRDAWTWASKMLGAVIPDAELVDPVIAQLLHENVPRTHVAFAIEAVGYYARYRGPIRSQWCDYLVEIILDETHPHEWFYGKAALILATADPIEVDALTRIAESLDDYRHLLQWRDVCRYFRLADSPLEDRKRFLEGLLDHRSLRVRVRARLALDVLADPTWSGIP